MRRALRSRPAPPRPAPRPPSAAGSPTLGRASPCRPPRPGRRALGLWRRPPQAGPPRRPVSGPQRPPPRTQTTAPKAAALASRWPHKQALGPHSSDQRPLPVGNPRAIQGDPAGLWATAPEGPGGRTPVRRGGSRNGACFWAGEGASSVPGTVTRLLLGPGQWQLPGNCVHISSAIGQRGLRTEQLAWPAGWDFTASPAFQRLR